MPTSEPEILSDNQFAADGVEGRRYARYVSFQGDVLKLAVRPAFGGRVAVLLNVSVGGLGFLLDIPLNTGDVLALDLACKSEDGSTVRLARVCHCRPHPAPADAPWVRPPSTLHRLTRWLLSWPTAQPQAEAWMIGCSFTRPLEEVELEQLLRRLRELSRQGGRRGAR
jgi:hypothetical protein